LRPRRGEEERGGLGREGGREGGREEGREGGRVSMGGGAEHADVPREEEGGREETDRMHEREMYVCVVPFSSSFLTFG
jgi:hypothetical protein